MSDAKLHVNNDSVNDEENVSSISFTDLADAFDVFWIFVKPDKVNGSRPETSDYV